jgi:Ion transport protein
VIRVNGKFRTRWDVFIICLSLWVCFSLPVHIAFEPPALDSKANQIFNSMIDILYAVDILLNFRTSYINVLTGDEIVDSKLIAFQYLKGGRFFLDLLSTIPFDMIIGNNDGS